MFRVFFFAGLVSLLIFSTPVTEAAVITVTSSDDNTTVDGEVTLREAVEAAETDSSVDGSTAGSGADTIVFDAALFSSGDITINLTQYSAGTNTTEVGPGAFQITGNLTIQGPTNDHGVVIERKSGQFRFFDVLPGRQFVLENITLDGGIAAGGHGGQGNGGGGGAAGLGGAIFNEGDLTLIRSTIANSSAHGGYGGDSRSGNGGGGGGGLGRDGDNASNIGGDGGDPNGATASGGNGSYGGGGAGGNERASAGPGSAGDGGAGGFGGGGAGGGYCLSTGGSPPDPVANAGDGGNGGFGAGAGGGGTAWSFNGTRNPGVAGTPGFGGGSAENGIVQDNGAGGDGGGGAALGGGIFNNGGSVLLVNSTISGCSAGGGNSGSTGNGDGGGGDGYGGGIFSRNGMVTLSNATIISCTTTGGVGDAGNGSGDGGGVYLLADNSTPHLHMDNSIVAGSTGAVHDVVAAVYMSGTAHSSGTGNLVPSSTGFTGTIAVTSSPLLGGLADNRGPTWTHAPLTGSPAIDAGDNAVAAGTTDQRLGDFTRIADGDLNGSTIVDIGAYELVFFDYGDAPDNGAGSGLLSTLLEVGDDDLRISTMGNDAEGTSSERTKYGAFNAEIAYNATENEYLVVWQGEDDTAPLVDGETEIHGVILDASDGSVSVPQFRISVMGDESETNATIRDDFDAQQPVPIWNSVDNEYLVVWYSDDDTGALVDNEVEVYGQRIAADGTLTGSRFRVSQMGPDGSTSYGTFGVDAVFNVTDEEYLIVWRADDDNAPLQDNDFEVFIRRYDTAGNPLAAQRRISNFGATNANPQNFDVNDVKVAWNSVDNEYLVVAYADDDTPPLVDNDFQIFGLRLNSGGTNMGTHFNISEMDSGDSTYQGRNPAVTYNPQSNQYFVVWYGDSSSVGDGEDEVWGEIVTAAGAEAVSRFRISDVGTEGDSGQDGFTPSVAYNSSENAYLVAWHGDDNTDNRFEIYAQKISAGGVELGDNDMFIGGGGPDGDVDYDQSNTDVAYNDSDSEFMVIWQGDDNTAPLVDGENEIFGQRILDGTVANYNTRASDDGACHAGVQGLRIGMLLDSESDGQAGLSATGDDLLDQDDEDGIPFAPIVLTPYPGQSITVTVTVQNTSGSAATLYGWVDFDADGQFENATERTSSAVPNSFTGTRVLTFPVTPAGATNATYARFRLSSDAAAANAWGSASDGEVEDYPVYQHDSDGDEIQDGWELVHFGDLTTATGSSDSDSDGMTDAHESYAGTQATNSSSFLHFADMQALGDNKIRLMWQRAPGKVYRIIEKKNINSSAAITNISNVSGPVASGGFITLTTGVTQADGILLLNLQ